MALYTGKGDEGTTKTFGCDQKISKSSAIAEALGNLDELNSYLGVIKVTQGADSYKEIVEGIQQNIFTISAELAGAEKRIGEDKVKKVEKYIVESEKELPTIKTFTIAGGTTLGAQFDFARTLARRAERRVVAIKDEGREVSKITLRYLNRLSSLLFALARLTNHRSGINESSPSYN
ncbi:MAG: cob(I)yrinic acid a,c-diamide adenosyltransferase [bacterium]